MNKNFRIIIYCLIAQQLFAGEKKFIALPTQDALNITKRIFPHASDNNVELETQINDVNQGQQDATQETEQKALAWQNNDQISRQPKKTTNEQPPISETENQPKDNFYLPAVVVDQAVAIIMQDPKIRDKGIFTTLNTLNLKTYYKIILTHDNRLLCQATNSSETEEYPINNVEIDLLMNTLNLISQTQPTSSENSSQQGQEEKTSEDRDPVLPSNPNIQEREKKSDDKDDDDEEEEKKQQIVNNYANPYAQQPMSQNESDQAGGSSSGTGSQAPSQTLNAPSLPQYNPDMYDAASYRNAQTPYSNNQYVKGSVTPSGVYPNPGFAVTKMTVSPSSKISTPADLEKLEPTNKVIVSNAATSDDVPVHAVKKSFYIPDTEIEHTRKTDSDTHLKIAPVKEETESKELLPEIITPIKKKEPVSFWTSIVESIKQFFKKLSLFS